MNKNTQEYIFIAFLIVIIEYFIYILGEDAGDVIHVVYVPIILAAHYWEVKGGVISAMISGIISGFVLGPFGPLADASNSSQLTANWVVRVSMFMLLGAFAGYIFRKLRVANEESRVKDLVNPFTGLYNTNKLFMDIKERIQNKEKFNVISIKLTNLEGIEKYVDYSIVQTIIDNLAEDIKHDCGRDAIYSASNSEIIVLACYACVDYSDKIKLVMEKYSHPVKIEDYTFRLSLKVGMYEYDGSTEDPEEIYNKARIAHEQGEAEVSGIYYYDEKLEDTRRDIYEITGLLHEALEKNQMYVVYQPKIRLSDMQVSGAEALIRWETPERGFISPGVFIEIAEDTGFIKDITNFVFNETTEQMIDWKKKGIELTCSLNLSNKDLADNETILGRKSVIDDGIIARNHLEFELTERAINEGDADIKQVLEELRKSGYIISIDDFGTGYNSLMSIGEIPFDVFKLDRYFINNLGRYDMKMLVKTLIHYAKSIHKKVVAEGVGTKEQLEILEELKCDYIQGYYFSKPLKPKEFEEFYFKFNKEGHTD